MATDAQVQALLKKHPNEALPFYAGKLNLPNDGKLAHLVWRNEPEADPSLKIKAGAQLDKELKEGQLRWERISYRSGKSVGELKKRFTELTGKDPSERYTGRGRKFVANGAAATTGGGSRRGAAETPAASGRRGAAAASGNGTSGRRGAAASKPAAATSSGRRGTRAAATSDPK